MPLLVHCEDLEPGMCLHEPVVSNGQIMLQSGRPLSREDILALKRRYPGVSVRIGDAVLDDAIEFEDDTADRSVADRVTQRVSDSMSAVQERFNSRTQLQGADLGAVNSAVKELIEYLKKNPPTAALVGKCLDPRTFLSTHTGNVFYLSMLLGSAVVDYVVSERKRQTMARDLRSDFASDLTSLGLGAMVMDVGMIPLADLFHAKKAFDEADVLALRRHTLQGIEALPQNFPATARMIVRTHHENFDGSGYPDRLVPEKVHVFTRIVRIADAYDTATSDRVFKQARTPARVLWEMLSGPAQRFYDPVLMRAFARLIQPFPIGAKIRLQDDRYGVVVRYNRENPFKPTIVVAFDAKEIAIPQEQLDPPIDLSRRPEIRMKSYQGEDLSFLYSTCKDEPLPSPGVYKTVYDAMYP